MHVRSWLTVMAFLATGAVSLPTPIPNGDLTAAADGNHITRAFTEESVPGAADSTADQTYNGAAAGVRQMRRAIAQPMRLVDSKREITVPTDHEALAGTKREESITADKSYEGVQWSGGGNRQRRNEKATADKSYEGVQWNGGGATKRGEAITADKSYEGAMKRGVSATMTSNGGVARARRDGDIASARADGSIQSKKEMTADKSYLGEEAR